MAAFTVFWCWCFVLVPKARSQEAGSGWGSEWGRMVGAENLASSPYRKRLIKALEQKDAKTARQIIDQWQKAVPNYYEPQLCLARWYASQKQPQEALKIFDAVLKNPQLPSSARSEALLSRADFLHDQGHLREAVADLIEANRQLDDPLLKNSLAWFLATSPDAALRDGKKAVQLALAANQAKGGQDAAIVDTLAAAYAETGDFAQAMLFQKKANALDPELRRSEGKARLKLYEKHQPYRENPSAHE